MSQRISDEAKKRKNQYIGRYNKQYYTVYTFKLRTVEDADLINAIKNSGQSICGITRIALEKYLGVTRKQDLYRAIRISQHLTLAFFTQKKRTFATVL